MLRIPLLRAALILAATTMAAWACSESATSITDVPATEARWGRWYRIDNVTGEDQTGPAGRELSDAIVVRVVDGRGRPAEGRPVYWKVETGGGSLREGQTTTDARGQAGNWWTLGGTIGAQSIEVRPRGGRWMTVSATATEPGSGTDPGEGTDPEAEVATIVASPGSVTFTSLGDGRNLSVTARDADGAQMSEVAFAWRSTRTSVATVSSSGRVTAAGTGTARIIVSESGVSGGPADTVDVEVRQDPASVEVTPSSLSLEEGAQSTLQARVEDARGNAIPGASMSWRSRNTGVATVSGSGVVSALSSGTATIEASSGGMTGTASVQVAAGTSPPPPGSSDYLFQVDFDDGRTVHQEMNRDGGGELLIGYGSHSATNGSYAEPSTNHARSGSRSARLSMDGAGTTSRAIRLQRWKELGSRREVYHSAWFYFPQNYSIQMGGFHQFWQFATQSSSRSYPMYILGWQNSSSGGMAIDLTWWPESSYTAGPSQGQSGRRNWRSSVEIPVGRWFQVEARYVCDSGYNGTVQFWVDGQQVFNLTNVRTADPASGSCYTSINNYGAMLQQSRVDLYVDDIVASPTRVGRN